MRLLIIGDIVGKLGRRAVQSMVSQLRSEFNCCFCIANGENIAGGAGLSENSCLELKNRGVDVVTTGDHVWDQKDFVHQIKSLPFVLRPANLGDDQPGKGYGVYNIPIGGKICVINLLGQVFMKMTCDNPFRYVDKILEEVSPITNTIVVDMHAEATSEKIAMGRYLDGRVTAVFGTHTHVQTADERVFPNGTAFITDVGMVGGRESVLGREIAPVLHRFSTGLPARFKVSDEQIEVNGAIVEFNHLTGKAIDIHRFSRLWQSS